MFASRSRAAAAPRVQAFGRGEGLGDHRAVEIGRQQAAIGGRLARRRQPALRPRNCAASRTPPAPCRPLVNNTSGAVVRGQNISRCCRHRGSPPNSAALSIPEPMVIELIAPAALRLDDRDPRALRHVAGIIDFQQVRPAGLADGQPKGLPAYVRGVGVGAQLGQIAQACRLGRRQSLPKGDFHSRGKWALANCDSDSLPSFSYHRGLAGSISPLLLPRRGTPLGGGRRVSSTTSCTRRSAIVRFQLNGCRTACDQLALWPPKSPRRRRPLPRAAESPSKSARRRSAISAAAQKLIAGGIEKLHADLRLASLGRRQAVRLDEELHRLAGREHEAVAPSRTRSKSPAPASPAGGCRGCPIPCSETRPIRRPAGSSAGPAGPNHRRPIVRRAAWPSLGPRPADQRRRSRAGCAGEP